MWFLELVLDLYGKLLYVMLHCLMWDFLWIVLGERMMLLVGIEDDWFGIWISYVDVDSFVHLRDHWFVALSEYGWEALKIGVGLLLVCVEEGWLVIYYGVIGEMDFGIDQ